MTAGPPSSHPRFKFSLLGLFAFITAVSVWMGACHLLGELFLHISLTVFLVGFWLVVLIDCRSHDDKPWWGLVVVCGGIWGALLYLVVRRPRRIEEYLKFRREIGADPPLGV